VKDHPGDDTVDWCGCSDAKLANDKKHWKRSNGLNGSYWPGIPQIFSKCSTM